MRHPSKRARPTTVTLLTNAFVKDSTGARSPGAAATTVAAVCSVQPGTPETVLDASGRWTTVATTTFRFDADPGLRPFTDGIQWLDGSILRTYTVMGHKQATGRGATHLITTMERT